MFVSDLPPVHLAPPAYVVAYAQAPAPASFMIASAGVDLEDAASTKESSRTGYPKFSAADLKGELGKLPPAQRKEYKHVREALASQAIAQTQLDALVAKHRVSYMDIKQHTVLDNLETIVSGQPVKGIDKAALARDLIQDICRPSTIGQAAHGTCTATSIQSALARNNPGEYARFVAGIGTGKGVVATRDGHFKLDASIYIPFKDRSTTSNLLQPAIMELEAENEGGHYNNKNDKIVPAKGSPHGGAYTEDVVVVASAIMGAPYKLLPYKHNNDAKFMSVLSGASPKYPLIVGVDAKGGGGHEMQVVGYEAGTKQVVFRNPWGSTLKTPLATFQKNTDGLIYQVH